MLLSKIEGSSNKTLWRGTNTSPPFTPLLDPGDGTGFLHDAIHEQVLEDDILWVTGAGNERADGSNARQPGAGPRAPVTGRCPAIGRRGGANQPRG